MMTLYEAIKQENLEEVKRILKEDPVCIDEKVGGIWLPNLAARLGNLDIVRYLVEYSRASFHDTDENNRTILHYAAESGNLSLIKYLVERVGMSCLDGDIHLKTPFHIVHEKSFQEAERYFEAICGARLDEMFQNPICRGMHPDPSIICVGEDFYMVNSSFIYFPCIPISHSKDLIHWEVIGHAITNPAWAYLDELEGGRGYWAPDISYYKGRFYITATYRFNDTGTVYRKQMVVSADRPEGPYCEPAFLDEDGIDPSIFTDEDGRRYMLLNRGARIFEISPDGTKQLSEAVLLYYGHQKRAPEGSHLLKKDGYYYLFQAEGGTGEGHRISVSRSKELFGIYTPCPYNPIMRQKNKKAAIQRCGHGKPVCTPAGEWYMVYLCGRQIDGKYSMLGRETALDPITWTADGWPLVNNLQGPSVLQKKPNLPEWKPLHQSDDFLAGILSTDWVSPRVPEKDAFTFQKGFLCIKGSKKSLSTMHARNLLLRRQGAFCFSISARLQAAELLEEQEYGLTCYYDENTYLTFGLKRGKKGMTLQVTEHIGDETTTSYETALEGIKPGRCLSLRIEASYLKRSFYYSLSEKQAIEASDWKEVGELTNVYYLCDEGLTRGKRFTGAMTGLYAFAGEEKEFTAKFAWIHYEEKEKKRK